MKGEIKDLDLGISIEELQEFYDYVAGKADKPLFVDKFIADINGRMKEMVLVVNELRLAQVPKLLEYYNRALNVLFEKVNLDTMDIKEVSALMTNVNKDILSIVEMSTKAIQTINGFDGLNSEYRNLLNGLMLISEDKLRELQANLK